MLGKDNETSRKSEQLPQSLFLKSKTESSEVVENVSPDRRRKSAMIFKRDKNDNSGLDKGKQKQNQMSYLMNKHSQEFGQMQSPLLTANIQNDYFSTGSQNAQDLIDKVEVKEVELRPAKKILLTPGNDLKEH